MSKHRLDLLPRELITHIATLCDAEAALQLCATCKIVRTATYDSLVFKSILLRSQRHFWKSDELDVDALATRAAKNVEVWARFAVADQRAYKLAETTKPPPQAYISYLPELCVIKHPVLEYAKHTGPFSAGPALQLDSKHCQQFCVVFGLMKGPWAKTGGDVDYSRFGELLLESRRFHSLWALAVIYATIKNTIELRERIWPYAHAANVPFIDPPKSSEIPLRPLGDSYCLPAPFSRTGLDVLGSSTSSFSSWDSWYDQHNLAAFQSETFLTSGSWVGYYMHGHEVQDINDPPMLNINFRITDSCRDPTTRALSEVKLVADDCHDGVDHFTITGTMSLVDRCVRFKARKQYRSQPGWDWDCRLTPFGLVGSWGHSFHDDSDRFNPHGLLWLWKSDWQGQAGAVSDR